MADYCEPPEWQDCLETHASPSTLTLKLGVKARHCEHSPPAVHSSLEWKSCGDPMSSHVVGVCAFVYLVFILLAKQDLPPNGGDGSNWGLQVGMGSLLSS